MNQRTKPTTQPTLTEALRGAMRTAPVSPIVINFPSYYLEPLLLSEYFAERLRVAAEEVEKNNGREFGFLVMRGASTSQNTIQTAFSRIGGGKTPDSTDLGKLTLDSIRKLREMGNNNVHLPLICVHFHPTSEELIAPSDGDLKFTAQMRAFSGIPPIMITALISKSEGDTKIKMLVYQEPLSHSPILIRNLTNDIPELIAKENLAIPPKLTTSISAAYALNVVFQLHSQNKVVKALEDHGYKVLLLSADIDGRISKEEAEVFATKFEFSTDISDAMLRWGLKLLDTPQNEVIHPIL